jgi:hypothetical protein
MLKISTSNFNNDEPIEQDPASPWNIAKPHLNLFRAVSLLRISFGAVIGLLGAFTDPVLVFSLASMLLEPFGLLNLLSKKNQFVPAPPQLNIECGASSTQAETQAYRGFTCTKMCCSV